MILGAAVAPPTWGQSDALRYLVTLRNQTQDTGFRDLGF